MTTEDNERLDRRPRIAVELTEFQWGMVRDAIARHHNAVLKRKSWRPSERAVVAVELSECIRVIEAAVPSTKPDGES